MCDVVERFQICLGLAMDKNSALLARMCATSPIVDDLCRSTFAPTVLVSVQANLIDLLKILMRSLFQTPDLLDVT